MRRLFILGAGASYAAGLPDGGRLPGHLFGYIGGAPWEVVRNRPPYEYFNPLYNTLFQVLRELATGGPQSAWPLDDVFKSFQTRFQQDLAGSIEVFNLLHEATAQLIYSRSCYGGTTETYQRFVRALAPGDVVLTFNWDSCVEIALYTTGCPFSRSLSANPPTDMPWLLKLHGSIDSVVVPSKFYHRASRMQPSPRQPSRSVPLAPFLEALGVEPPPLLLIPPSPWMPVTGLDPSDTEPPLLPSGGAYTRYELARLRTYDLEGYELKLTPTDAAPRADDAATRVAEYDIVFNPSASVESSRNDDEDQEDNTPPDTSDEELADDELRSGVELGGTDVGPYLLLNKLDPRGTLLMLTPATPDWMYDWYYATIRSAIESVIQEIGHIYVVGYSFPHYDQRVFSLLRTLATAAGHPPTDIVNPGAADLPQEILTDIFNHYRLHACGFQEFDWGA